MFKLLMFLIVIGLSGCTQHQRFALRLNAQLDACAMKRMSETKISGQQGYLQAHYECHKIVNIDKGHALHLERVDVSTRGRKDELEGYELCWDFVKAMVIDKNYPDLRLIGSESPSGSHGHKLTEAEKQENIVILSFRKFALPDKLGELNKEKLIMVRDTMQSGSVIGHDTMCSPWSYHELGAIIGREIHRRYPQGVDTNIVGNFK